MSKKIEFELIQTEKNFKVESEEFQVKLEDGTIIYVKPIVLRIQKYGDKNRDWIKYKMNIDVDITTNPATPEKEL